MWQTLEKNDVIRRLNTKEREGLTEEDDPLQIIVRVDDA